MDLFNREELRRLAELEEDVCISLYMPTYRNESDWSQNTTRLKNLLSSARDQLRDQDYREGDIDSLLSEARQQLDRPGFWRKMSEGLAVFITPETTEFYRLPLSFEEVVVADDRFHLKPLFPIIASNNRFYLLALGEREIRLYQGTHESVSPVSATDFPDEVVEAMNSSVSTNGTAGEGSTGEQEVEDQGSSLTDEAETQLESFFENVDERLCHYLGDEEVPLLLAGRSDYLPIYEEVNSYPNLLSDAIRNGVSAFDVGALHQAAWAIVDPVFQSLEEDELDRFEQLFYQNEDMASDNFNEIIPACAYSRVDTLFVPVGEYRWGRFDPETNTVEVHESQKPGDGDLLNYAAVRAYLTGATVHVMRPENMPGGRSIAATFRYQADISASEEG
jgi:hypothetical protein